MPNLGFSELMIILVVALLIFGPKSIPQIGKSIGNGIREFKDAMSGKKHDDEDRKAEAESETYKIDEK
ncbi:MAG: twin-arginine translocase TatA/TatE family subunit [Firmicutes bacterium]|nr:twin-arginine translocase TatA/TatE family subunit [Bacillota bacterium]